MLTQPRVMQPIERTQLTTPMTKRILVVEDEEALG
jgi:hypothetical protein